MTIPRASTLHPAVYSTIEPCNIRRVDTANVDSHFRILVVREGDFTVFAEELNVGAAVRTNLEIEMVFFVEVGDASAAVFDVVVKIGKDSDDVGNVRERGNENLRFVGNDVVKEK